MKKQLFTISVVLFAFFIGVNALYADDTSRMSLRSYKMNGEEYSSELNKEVVFRSTATGYILVMQEKNSKTFATFTFRTATTGANSSVPFFMVFENDEYVSGYYATILRYSNGVKITISSFKSDEESLEIEIY